MAKATENQDQIVIVEQVAQQQAKQDVSDSKPVQMVYYGPNLPGGLLSQWTVFNNGLPEQVFEKHPSARAAFVPVGRMVSIMQRLQDKNSIEFSRFKAIIDEIKGV